MRRMIAFGLAVTVLYCMFAVSAMATPTTPYTHYDVWFQGETQGVAGIYRCSCNPVNNELQATAHAQYMDEVGQYNWTNTVSDGGTNIQQCVFVVTDPTAIYVNYVEANFTARCGTGFPVELFDCASR